MYKTMRKILVMTMVLAVCMNVAVVPALADEPGGSSSPVTVTITTTEDDGSTTTTTTTQSSTTSTTGGTTTTQNNTVWDSQNIKTDSQKSESGGSTTTVDTNITTDKVGSETTTTSQNSSSVSGSFSGEESTEVTSTTTTTTDTKDTLISSETTSGQDAGSEEEWTNSSVEGGTWTTGDVQTGAASETGESSEASQNISYERTDDGVTLEMNVKHDTDTKEAVVKANTADGKLSLPDAGTTTEEIKDDADNVVGYKITTITKEEIKGENDKVVGWKVTTTVAETGAPTVSGPTVTTKTGDAAPASEAPGGYQPGTYTDTQTDGDKTIQTDEVIEETKDDSGKVIGYTITTTRTTTEPASKETLKDSTSKPVQYILPDKPEESVTTDASGNTTTVTVTEILEDGEVVGYQKDLVITDPDGNEIYSEQEQLFRTEKQDSTETVKDVDTLVTTQTTTKTIMGTAIRDVTRITSKTYIWQTTVNTTEEVYDQVNAQGELYVLYKGTMIQVTPGGEHGKVTMTSIQPDYEHLMPPENTVDREKDLYHRTNSDEIEKGAFNGYDFQWLGEYGLESAIRVRANKTDTYQAHQFVLKDAKGEKHYVYCADLITSPEEGFRYNMENIFDADYCDDESAAHIQAIAVNGYWGTASGVGSLQAVKDMLKAAQNANKIPGGINFNDLTDGEALTATQAAIWVFGNSKTEENHVTTEDPVGWYYLGNKKFDQNMDPASEARVKAMFDYLCKTDPPATDTTTPLITKDNFATETSITVKDKVTDETGDVKKDASGNEVYNTDIRFNLSIERSKLTGNLSVQVVDASGKVLDEKYLITDDSNPLGVLFGDDGVSPDGTYVFKDLQIAENTRIDLKLSGIQNLGFGAYLYSAEVRDDENPSHSQTFVGLSEGTRKVDLRVELKFEVSEPTSTKELNSATRTDTRTDTKTDTIHQLKVNTQTQEQIQKDWYGTITVTSVVTEKTQSNRSWLGSFFRTLPKDEPGDPGGGTTGKKLSDADVPLAKVPKTGDLSMMWAAVSVLAIAGYLLLGRKKEERA